MQYKARNGKLVPEIGGAWTVKGQHPFYLAECKRFPSRGVWALSDGTFVFQLPPTHKPGVIVEEQVSPDGQIYWTIFEMIKTHRCDGISPDRETFNLDLAETLREFALDK